MTLSHFRDLEVWNLAMELARTTYQITASFPETERYGITVQIQRSAVSIPSNIAEGNARATTREYARFVSIALGSTAELQTQLLLAKDLNLGEFGEIETTLEVCERVGQMLQRLHQALRRRMTSESRVPSPESR